MSTVPLELFRRLTSGVSVIGVAHRGRHNAFTAAWLTQVSFSPLLVTLSVNPDHYSWPLLQAAGAFTVNVLRAEDQETARHFGTESGRTVDKLATQPWRPSPTGLPILVDALAWLDCAVEAEHPAGDHVLVVARVIGGELLDSGAEPLLYRDTGNLDGSASLYPPRFEP